MEVVDDGGAAQVEQVLARAQVAGAAALPMADMGQAVLDLGAFTQSRPTVRGLLTLAELDQQGLRRCCVASTQGRLKANIHWDQIAETSSWNATVTRRLVGSSTASS